jgi:Na+-translocating ferredoxin:NAD+ oxidoreductase RnfG subunit
MLKATFNKAPGAVAVALALAVFWSSAPARADVFFTVRDLLAQQFKSSECVSFVHQKPTAAQRQKLEQRLGQQLPKDDYVIYVAKTGEHVDGYAVFDEERGQHELISFGAFFDADGRVTRVEVMAYREPYGDGIRAARFRQQFVGRSGKSSFAPDRDIDAVSGATISSRSMCMGVQRASLLVEALRESGGTSQYASR